MKYKSCAWIEKGINFDIDSYKVCCLYSAKGGGNTIIKQPFHGGQVNWDEIFEFKKMMKDMHKNGETYPKCEGCIYFEDKEWDDDHTKISMINLDYWTKCNSRCSYCHTMKDKHWYNNYKNYDFLPILKDMIKKDILRPDGHVSFGGGEVTMLREFETILNTFIDFGMRFIRVHSSCILYSKAVEKGLKKNCMDLIVSVDAGSKQMHKKIKQVDSYDKVWSNLKKYASHQVDPNAVKVKYILIPGVNDTEEELSLWLEKAKSVGVNYVLQEIESQWFYARREDVPDRIFELFEFAKQKAISLGLTYGLYERAQHMMEYRKNKGEEE